MHTLPLPLHTILLLMDIRSLLFNSPKLSRVSSHLPCHPLTVSVPVQVLFARAARLRYSITCRAPSTAFRRCVMLLVYSLYLFRPHTFLVAPKMLWMALRLGVSNIGAYSASLTQTYARWWTLPSFISQLTSAQLMNAEKPELLFRVIKTHFQKPCSLYVHLALTYCKIKHGKPSEVFTKFSLLSHSNAEQQCLDLHSKEEYPVAQLA